MTRRLWPLLILGLALGGLWQVGASAYIHAKAALAQVLLHQSWERTLAGESEVKPWPWADTWPVARLTVPRLEVDQIVLAGATGRTLAFGPALLDGGAPGHIVLTGHRDTHFRFLRDLAPGDTVHLTRADGRRTTYTIRASRVVHVDDARVAGDGSVQRLILATCYPFDAIHAGGPLRYLVSGERAAGNMRSGAIRVSPNPL